MYKSYSMELAGRTLTVDIGRVAKQANGAALMHYGDTTVLSTATASKEPREGIDFFPLSVEYEEKMYAAGKISGSQIHSPKREGPSASHSRQMTTPIDAEHSPSHRLLPTLSWTGWLFCAAAASSRAQATPHSGRRRAKLFPASARGCGRRIP